MESYRHYLAAKGIKTRYSARKRDEDLPSTILDGKRFMEAEVKLVPLERIEPSEELAQKDVGKIERFKMSGEFHTPVKAFAPWATKEEAEKLGFKPQFVDTVPNEVDIMDIIDTDDGQISPNDPEAQTAIYHDPSKYVLFDGHHRLRGAIERGDKAIPLKSYKYPYQYREKRRVAGLKI